MNKYIRSKEISFDLVGEELLLLNPKEAKAYECNEIVSEIWEMLSREVSEDEIINNLLNIYEVEQEELTADIKMVLSDLLEKELILKK